jgi:uncharacterized protein YodC (DUF2158 family)
VLRTGVEGIQKVQTFTEKDHLHLSVNLVVTLKVFSGNNDCAKLRSKYLTQLRCFMLSFQIGDTVELKSGGPAMTIARLESEMGVLRAQCQWFDKNGTAQQHFYSVTSLKPSDA